MRVQVDNKGFTFFDHRFIYDLYYFDCDEWVAPTLAETFKKILFKWAAALEKISTENSPLFLPFAPGDEDIECLRATYRPYNMVTFSWVRIAENGYAVDLCDLETFSTAKHKVERESSEFGESDKDEVIFALLNAEVIDRP